jgi:hypothetical protein
MLMKWLFRLNEREVVAEMKATIEPLLPKQYDYAMHTRDLRNIEPTDLMTDNQGERVGGKFGVSDAMTGAASPVVWGFFIPIVLLSLLSCVGYSLAAVNDWIPFKAWAHSVAGTPSLLWAVWDLLKGVWLINLVGALPALAMSYYGYVVIAETDPNRMPHNMYWFVQVPLVMAISILVPFVSPALGAVASLFFPFFLYWVKLNAAEAARHQNLRDASSDSRGVTAMPDGVELERQREKQAADALKEAEEEKQEPELFTLGVSMGVLRNWGDPMTPDRGAVIGFSMGKDAGKNLWAFGKPGTGKSSAVAQRAAALWRGTKGRLKRRHGGALIMDAKSGELVVDLHSRGMIDILVDPNHRDIRVNLFGSLDAQRFATVLKKIAAPGGNAAKEGAIFDKSAAGYAEAARVVIGFAVEKGVPGVKDGFRYWGRFVTETAVREALLVHLSTHHTAEIESRPALLSNFISWAQSYPNLAENTRTSVDFTLRAWVMQLLGNPKLEHLLDDDGIDLADAVMKGAFVGLTLCENDGDGALMALALIKAAVFGRIQDRGRKPFWRLTEKRVLVLVDECSKLLDSSDEVLASQGRSLGLVMVYMTQDINQLIDQLGNEKTRAMLNCFGQLVAFETSAETWQYICGGDKQTEANRIGTRYRLVKDGMEMEAALLQNGIEQESASGLENRSMGGMADFVGAVTTTIASLRRVFSLQWQANDKEKNMFRTQATDKYRAELMPAMSAAEASMVIKGTHVCLVVLSRAGLPRREVCNARPGIEDEPDNENVRFFQAAATLALTNQPPQPLLSTTHRERVAA